MIDPAPAHVGDMQQAVEAIEVDERAEVREVLDHAGANLADLHAREQCAALVFTLLLDQLTTRENDIVALLVDLDDFELESFAEVFIEVAGRDDVDLRGGEEGVDADVDHQAALDLTADFAIDGAALGTDADDAVPVLLLLGPGERQHDHAVVVFEALQEDLDLVAHLGLHWILEFRERDCTLGFVTDIHQHFIRAHFEDAPFDQHSLGESLHLGE